MLYSPDFPKRHKIEYVDVVALYHGGKFEELNQVIICKSNDGKVRATFGESQWNLRVFIRGPGAHQLNFNEWNTSQSLQRELKLIAFGILFNRCPQQRKALKPSTSIAQVSKLKIAFRFLAKHQLTSLSALSKPTTWAKFGLFLKHQDYSLHTIELIFTAINAVIKLAGWHRLQLGITRINTKECAKPLSDRESQQTLVIPERLCHEIYGKAIALIEEAIPYKQLIADTENALQNNYLESKRLLEIKMQQGHTFTFMGDDGKIDKRRFALAIKDTQPMKPKDILIPLRKKIAHIKHGEDFNRYLGQLINACYIICGGFSGMRESELNKLTPNSYYKDTFDGRDYHMLQSHTFKLGEKREAWVTATISEHAIELVSALTMKWRKETKYSSEKYANSLWINQRHRSKPPVLITEWCERLRRFCRQFNFVITKNDYQDCVESNPRSIDLIKKYIIVDQPWPLASHQFRRTLAFYCIKNRLGTLVALKQQFKHIYLAMAEWYTNGGKLASLRDLMVDLRIKKALNEINAETTANKIFKQWHSDEKLSGTHGKAIMKMRGEVPTIYSSWDVIYKAVRDGKLTLHGSMHSYCKSGYDCDMDGVVIPQFCVDCSSDSSIIDEQQAKWWQKKHLSLVTYMELGEDISVSERSHFITQIRAAENVMKDFDMPFIPFEPELKVTEL